MSIHECVSAGASQHQSLLLLAKFSKLVTSRHVNLLYLTQINEMPVSRGQLPMYIYHSSDSLNFYLFI